MLLLKNFCVPILLVATGSSLLAQDILLSDFEETNYVWLPGGIWTTTGTCFGSGPTQGTLIGQLAADGYLGNGLVNTFLGGDTGTGTLVSPPFMIQRNYIKFLIGGGSYHGEGGYGGETRIDLLVGGQVVQHAAGPGNGNIWIGNSGTCAVCWAKPPKSGSRIRPPLIGDISTWIRLWNQICR